VAVLVCCGELNVLICVRCCFHKNILRDPTHGVQILISWENDYTSATPQKET
jgi:hypothetical protein